MFSQTKLNKLKELAESTDLKSGLTDAQVIWIKDKVTQIELWKDIAVAKLTNLENRIETLETKAAQAQIKFNQIDTKIANIEARLTAHGI